jgi:hypothetical protein
LAFGLLEKKKMMHWSDVAVKPHFSWPNKSVEIPFEGRRVVLQPSTEENGRAVSVFDEQGMEFDEGATIVSRFLSRLAWSKDGGIEELFTVGSNNPARPGLVGHSSIEKFGWAAVDPWDFLYLPIVNDPDADLALALYREAMSVNSIPFAFLSYFKILNIEFSRGVAQKEWIDQNHSVLSCPQASERVADLLKKGLSLGDYLYNQGRCAVAHANESSRVNPDSFSERRRLGEDVLLIKALVAKYIENELGVLTESSFFARMRNSRAGSPEFLRKSPSSEGPIVYSPVVY